jgi:hypothetical protein
MLMRCKVIGGKALLISPTPKIERLTCSSFCRPSVRNGLREGLRSVTQMEVILVHMSSFLHAREFGIVVARA